MAQRRTAWGPGEGHDVPARGAPPHSMPSHPRSSRARRAPGSFPAVRGRGAGRRVRSSRPAGAHTQVPVFPVVAPGHAASGRPAWRRPRKRRSTVGPVTARHLRHFRPEAKRRIESPSSLWTTVRSAPDGTRGGETAKTGRHDGRRDHADRFTTASRSTPCRPGDRGSRPDGMVPTDLPGPGETRAYVPAPGRPRDCGPGRQGLRATGAPVPTATRASVRRDPGKG